MSVWSKSFVIKFKHLVSWSSLTGWFDYFQEFIFEITAWMNSPGRDHENETIMFLVRTLIASPHHKMIGFWFDWKTQWLACIQEWLFSRRIKKWWAWWELCAGIMPPDSSAGSVLTAGPGAPWSPTAMRPRLKALYPSYPRYILSYLPALAELEHNSLNLSANQLWDITIELHMVTI